MEELPTWRIGGAVSPPAMSMWLPPNSESQVTAEIAHGSMFVDTVGLTGLEGGFFGDLELFEGCLQSFPEILFCLVETRGLFNFQYQKRSLSLLLL